MKTKKRHLIILLALLLGNAGLTLAQAPDPEYIYFDLSAGKVMITATKYAGYIYQDGTITDVKGDHLATNKYYIYQSQKTYSTATDSYYTKTGKIGDEFILPTYADVYVGETAWADYITNNSDVDLVNSKWEELAPGTNREVVNNIIELKGDAVFDITIDNLWSRYGGDTDGSIYINNDGATTYNSQTTIRLKNTSKLVKVFYNRARNTGTGFLKFTSADGDESNTGSLTLTVPASITSISHFSLIGAYNSTSGSSTYGAVGRQVAGVYFDGGTIYAGMRKINKSGGWNNIADDHAVIGGITAYGEFYINGGRLTAVGTTTSAVIGGGGGVNGGYGPAKIEITGGAVYAYNFGIWLENVDGNTYGALIPSTAIGGGSSGAAGDHTYTKCGDADITITGGTVYALSRGGVAIGGGMGLHQRGGDANISISGGAEVTAVSEAGDVYGHSAPAYNAIGGGKGYTAGGNLKLTVNDDDVEGTLVTATCISGGAAYRNSASNITAGSAIVTINGGTVDCNYIKGGDRNREGYGNPGSVTLTVEPSGTLKTGYVRGGKNKNDTKYGKADITINGGTVQGQFLLYGNATADNSFTMTGGILNNTNLGVVDAASYPRLETEGGAVYLGKGTVTLSGGTITHCSGTSGGAIYSNGASSVINVRGGTITQCSGTDGGAIYLGAGTLTMTDGTIMGNTATDYGGGVYINSGASFAMSGGTITGNTATTNGGGVYKLGSMLVSGSPVVKGNTAGGKANNVYIPSSASEKYVNFSLTDMSSTGMLNCGTMIGITKTSTEHEYSTYTEIAKTEIPSVTMSSDDHAPIRISALAGYLQKIEFLIPKEMLRGLAGKTITRMTFYLNQATSFKSLDETVFMKEVDNTSLSGWTGETGSTQVYQSEVELTSATEMTISFSNNFTYSGDKNLLIGFYKKVKNADTEATATSGSEFIGITTTNNCLAWGNSKSESFGSLTLQPRLKVLPQITFTTTESKTWDFPPTTSTYAEYYTAACDNHFFFDDTQTCGVYNSTDPSTPAPTLNTLYFVSDASNSWLRQASSAAVTTDYTLNAAGTHVASIKTANGLAYFASEVLSGKDYAGQTVTLTNDINLSGHNWEPAGFCAACGDEGTTTFAGTFDGQGHRIYNLNCNYDYKNVGLFGHVTGTVKNVIVSGTVTGSGATNVGGIAGELGGGTIYNCISTATLSGGTNTGALVGKVTSGSLLNSFAISNDLVCGTGTATNCYVRKASGGTSSDMGTATNVGASGSTTDVFTVTVTPYKYKHNDNKVGSETGAPSLLAELNAWVDAQSTPTDLAHWTRTCASPINGDYPLLKMPGTICVGSNDNIELQYRSNLNTLMTDITDVAGHNIFLYNNADGVTADNVNRGIYIAEDAALIHTSIIDNAYVGITLKDAAWHMFSPAISAAPLGIDYDGDDDPCGYGTAPTVYAFYPEATADGYFPSTNFGGGSYYSDYDYYSYYEPEYHWINFKRNSRSHWHEDIDHRNIEYHWDNDPDNDESEGNETTLKPGKGYLLGIKTDTYLQSHGTLNPSDGASDVTFPVTKRSNWRTGYNLIGNPYQAYLDFEAFADDNSGSDKIWSEASSAFYLRIYEGAYRSYVYGSSSNQLQAPRCLHPHQGFMVITENNTNATFKNTHRVLSNATAAPFRGEASIDYPLVNLIATDEDGKSDILTVELGRPEAGGAQKAYDLHTGKGCLYVNYEDKDYGIAFTKAGIDHVSVRFAADEEANFTMTWDMENGEFSYVHLIDNMMGIDIDCLNANEYRFTARPSDYKSRFRLVFDYTGIEEPEVSEPVEGPTTFAFQMNNELVVNGEGQLQMFDLTGRLVMSANTYGTQSSVALPEISKGMYVLRINGKNGIKTQKIVIK